MDYGLEYSEEQREYLERVGMREQLESFVVDAVREKPDDIYAFLQRWATARSGKTPSMTSTQAAIKIQCAQRKHNARTLLKIRQDAVRAQSQQEQEENAATGTAM
ncbi:hypothetical protein DQ04_03041120 [Trypanosoma grayi]|uniref:hypothetical protein n=1 Tax=Trypanosoma grayi TaxID=71804 RepID=UPI0004F4699B|nr:hypothetical protein DQ04_03041120 [Trypanosoma grayi]KEG11041.1 hypothetical protein DQ04_03041120 [Trypanosoma grayi]